MDSEVSSLCKEEKTSTTAQGSGSKHSCRPVEMWAMDFVGPLKSLPTGHG